MKLSSAFTFLAILLTSCSKQNDTIDPQQFPGTYKVNYVETYTSTTAGVPPETSKGSFTVIVDKGATSNQLVFSDGTGTLSVALNGSSFTGSYKRSWAFAPSTDVAVSGSFSKNALTYTETAKLTATIRFSAEIQGSKQ